MQFFWHDYESFGVNPRRDRPAQFAGIRTDEALNEIDAPVMLYCQPSLDTLPQPEACLLTGIGPAICTQRGVPEPVFAQTVLHELSRPGTVGVGYNSIRFDDEMTRFLLWRNLHDPYAREWQNDCGRWDILDVLRCAYALRPQVLNWPLGDDGKVSFKLDRLTVANDIAHSDAHDALADVRATIALARLLRERAPKLWEFCLGLRRKDAVLKELAQPRPVLHVSGMYGVDRACLAVVWPLAQHPTNKNEIVAWDLAQDPSVLLQLSTAEIKQRLFTAQKDLPEGVQRLPMKTIHINKSPVVVGQVKTLSDERAKELGIDWPQTLVHAQSAAAITQKLAGLWPEVFAKAADDSAAWDVDEALYQGFMGNADRRRLDEIRLLSAPPTMGKTTTAQAAQPTLLAQLAQRTAFDDPRLEELVFRFRARHFAAGLNEHERERWRDHLQAFWLEELATDRLAKAAQKHTSDTDAADAEHEPQSRLSAYFAELDKLGETHAENESAMAMLEELYDWGHYVQEHVEGL